MNLLEISNIRQIVSLCLAISFIALAINNRAALKKHYKMGLLFGAITLIFKINNPLIVSLFKDSEIFNSEISILFLNVLSNGLVYFIAAAEWEILKPYSFPFLWKSDVFSRKPVILAGVGSIIIGIIFGFFLSILYDRSNAHNYFYPTPVYYLFYSVIGVIFVSLVEELIFRGVLFGVLLRLTKRTTRGIVISTIAVSFFWTIIHFNKPFWMYIVIFIFGIILCELVRRWDIETAIVAHCSYNAALVLVGTFWEIDETFDHIVMGIILLGILLWAGIIIARKFCNHKTIQKTIRIIFILSFIVSMIVLISSKSYDKSENTINYGVFTFSLLLLLYLIKIIVQKTIFANKSKNKSELIYENAPQADNKYP